MITFKQYLLEANINPIVTHSKHKQTGTFHMHDFHVQHPLLNQTANVRVVHHGDNPSAKIDVYDQDGDYSHMGHMGAKNVMHVIGRLKHHLPSHITHIQGDRVTGARKHNFGGSKGSISIEHTKPIPPDDK
jgi:hypothetical protein